MNHSKVITKVFLFVLSGLLVVIFNSSAYAEWNFGIGTGISGQLRDGDIGVHTNLFGPVELDYDLDSEDFSDLMESAFGFGGYLSNGKWMIQYSLGYIELEGNTIGIRANGSPVTGRLTFETTSAEVTVGHTVLKRPHLVLGVHTGIRYLNHEFETVVISGPSTFIRDMDENWTDLLLGVTGNIPITQRLIWANKINAGFGGSEGTFFVSTGLMWRFHKNFSTSITAKFLAVEFENGSKGDTDWYLYDVDESNVGISFLFHW
jgi:hypothetical protein